MIDVDLIKRSSPSSLSITEFKSDIDIGIVEKMLRFPLLGEELDDTWNVKLYTGFNMTTDSDLFHDAPGRGRLPLYQGRMIWQFEHGYSSPIYWIDEEAGRERLIGKRGIDRGQTLDYQLYRFGFRAIASGTNTRTFISSMLIPNVFQNYKIHSFRLNEDGFELDNATQLCACGLCNSFVLDYLLRQRVTTDLTFPIIRQLPVPRLQEGDPYVDAIVERAARLICTAPEYDDLAREVGLGGHHNGATAPAERAQLRAELDGMIAHIYGLSDAEFAHVLATFPLVAGSVKAAALAAYRAL